MNELDFLNIIKTPQHINEQQTDGLKNVIEKFPYFQPAKALYLKGLKNTNSFKYNNALKTAAAHTTDRSILFDFITSEIFIQNEVSKIIKQNTLDLEETEAHEVPTKLGESEETVNTYNQEIANIKKTLDPDLFQPKTEAEQEANIKETDALDIEKETATENNTLPVETILAIGEPLNFNKNETHSFNEWLALTRLTPINRETEPKTADNQNNAIESSKKTLAETLARAKKFQLIEKFIEKSPKLAGNKAPVAKHNIAKAQMIQPEALMTETLARVYLEQKNYKKAIQSYKILSLKYPEKSGFFADQIKAVKELKEQNNIE